VQPPEAPLFVRLDELGDSAINVMVYCFTRTTDWGEWLRIKEALANQITAIAAAADAGLAFPSQSLYIETFPRQSLQFEAAPAPAAPAPQKPA
jgi:MscS family membrane protein